MLPVLSQIWEFTRFKYIGSDYQTIRQTTFCSVDCGKYQGSGISLRHYFPQGFKALSHANTLVLLLGFTQEAAWLSG